MPHRRWIAAALIGLALCAGYGFTRGDSSPAPPHRSGGLAPAADVLAFEWSQEEAARQAEAARIAAEEADQAQAAAQANAQRAQVSNPVQWSRCNGDFECFRACTIQIESGGNYATNTGNGYFGAWQFNQSTWDGAVARAGHPEWAGQAASSAPQSVQDAAAAQLYAERGSQPWGGRC